VPNIEAGNMVYKNLGFVKNIHGRVLGPEVCLAYGIARFSAYRRS
jgi:hypothetical protein